jgi:hypothetical protein
MIITANSKYHCPPEACAAAFAASFACRAAASLRNISGYEKIATVIYALLLLLFASLQRCQVSAILTLAFHRRLQTKK